MSEAWSHGKGDKTRVSNVTNYVNNFQNIDFGRYLFLDDVRLVKEGFIHSENNFLTDITGIPENKWDVVRSYDEFCKYLDNRGIPTIISFDNDLEIFSTDMTIEEFRDALMMKNWITARHKTGCHCALYLKDKCDRIGKAYPKYYIHSANKYAPKIIKNILG